MVKDISDRVNRVHGRASTAREVFTSSNLGETWQPLGIKEKWPLPYARGIMVEA
jgi:hypothetical protein